MSAVSVVPLHTRLARNTAWSICGSVLSQGSSLVTAIIVGRLLGAATFGRLTLIQTTILLFGTIGELGLSLTITKFVSRWSIHQAERAGKLIGNALLITAVCTSTIALLLACFAISSHALGFQDIPIEFRTGCLLLISESLNRVQTGALAGFEAFNDIAKINVLRGVVSVSAVWIGTIRGGLEGVLIALVVASVITLLFGHLLLREHCRRRLVCLRCPLFFEKEVLSTSLSLWVSMLLLFGSTWAVTLMLSGRPGGAVQLGIFNAAEKWKAAVLFIPNMLFQVTLPMLSQAYAVGDRRVALRVMLTSILSSVGVASVGAIALWVLAGPLMSSYGGDFSAGRQVLSLAAGVALLNAFYTVGSSGLWAVGRPSTMLRIDLARTVVLVAGCYLGLASSALDLNYAFLISYAVGSGALLYSVLGCFASDFSPEPV